MATHKYRPGEYVVVNSPHYGDKPAIIEQAYVKSGMPFYKVDIDGVGPSNVTEHKIRGRLMKSFSERVDEEMTKKMAATSDESTENFIPPKAEIKSDPNPEKDVQVPGGAPGPLSPEDKKRNPNDVVNPKAVEDMGAKHNLAMDPNKGKEWWDTVTSGKTHKITACMEAAKSFADDPGAFCKSLADEVGYDPNA